MQKGVLGDRRPEEVEKRQHETEGRRTGSSFAGARF